ncbi:MAG: protein kinase [Pirellulales bacterium]
MAQTYHRYRAGDKPVGGYRLVRKLGEGGFGEVWQACAPGGAEVALKFIDLTGQQGFREFKSLRLVKKITHNNLTPLHGFWLKNEDGTLIDESDVTWSQISPAMPSDLGSPPTGALATAIYAHPVELIVAMGLGKKSLYDRLRECQDEGLGGIPADELLDYMEDAAKGIDYLNRPIHDMGQGPMPIVHSDIKPHNILIVGDGAQVCDFGLAHAVESLRKTCQAPLTLAYAAPESFRGKPCDKSDQYSLAISFVELRTGSLPFDEGMTGFEVMTAHVQGQLDFSRLTPAEESVIRKATSPLPQDRWRTSREMILEIRRALRLTPGTSDYLPDVRGTPPFPTGPDYRGTSAPPTFPKGDTSPFSGQTPSERDPALRTMKPASTTATVMPALTERRPPIPRRPMSTAAKLFISLLFLGAMGGVGGYFYLNPPQGSGPVVKQDDEDKSPEDTGNGKTEHDPAEEDPEEQQRRLAAKDKEDQRRDELAKNAPKQAFAEFLQAEEFDKALNVLTTSGVFTEAEKTDNRLKLQTGWRAHADQAFLAGEYETAADNYAALAKEFYEVLPGADLNLMQARARIGANDLNTAQKVMTGVSQPAQRQTPRDRMYFLIHLVLADQTKSPTGINQLHKVWNEHHGDVAASATGASGADLWTAKSFELDALSESRSEIVSNWLQAAVTRSLPKDEEELKRGLDEVTKIVQIDEKNVDAWVIKGDLHLALNQWPQMGEAIKKQVALGRQPVRQALKDRARVLDACYDLNNARDKQTLDAALASVPRLMRFKNAQHMLAGSVHALTDRLPEYLPAAVEALRNAAESSEPESDLRPLFALMLAKEIRRQLGSEPEFALKAEQFQRDCEFVAKHAGSPDEFVRACHAESLLALNEPGALQILGSPGKSPYYQYVKARVLSRTADSAADLRNTLAALFSQPPTPELRQANRIKLAFDALEQGLSLSLPSGALNIARALEPPSDPNSLDVSYDLLRNAYGWSDANTSLSDVTRAHLAAAAWWHPNPNKKDEGLARKLTASLVGEWKKNLHDEVHNPGLVYHLYYTYLEAHRTAGDKPTQEANLAVVDRLLALTKKKKLDDEQVQAFYRRIVAPFEPTATNRKDHRFFARTAEVVADAAHLDWGFADSSGRKLSVNDKLEGLFSSAVNLSVAKEPQYFLARGRVRLNRKPFDLNAVLADAEALRRFKQFEASAYTLAGQAHFYQSRQEPTHAGRLKALDESLAILRQAIPSGGPDSLSDDQQAERLLLLSYVHLERRNFAGWDTSAVNDFEKAAEYALQAEKFLKGSALELAYSAAGNAFEDLAWYTRSDVETNYKKAVDNFGFAIRANPASVAARLNLGRCYYKMAAVSGVSPPGVGTLRGIVVKAEAELREAITRAESQSRENPEAHYWLGKVLQVKHLDEDTPVEKAKQRLNAAEFRAADDELMKALDLAVKQNMADNALRLFAVELAENVLLHPDFYSSKSANTVALAKVAARADELKKLNLPRTTGVDLDQEVKVLNARAKLLTDSGIAALGELDEAARDLLRMDADKASASDSKVMELRFEVFADLKPRELTDKRIEDWLNEAIWYARLPRTIIRKDPTSILIAARKEAEKASTDVAGKTVFTAFEPAWLQAAIESSPRDNRVNEWYKELVLLNERQIRAAGANAKGAAENAAKRMENLIEFLDRRGRNGEADLLRAYPDAYRKRPQTTGTTKAKTVSRPSR